jgi:hypothetical protein
MSQVDEHNALAGKRQFVHYYLPSSRRGNFDMVQVSQVEGHNLVLYLVRSSRVGNFDMIQNKVAKVD